MYGATSNDELENLNGVDARDVGTSERHNGLIPYTMSEFRFIQDNFITNNVELLSEIFDILTVCNITL